MARAVIDEAADTWGRLAAYIASPDFDFDKMNAHQRCQADDAARGPAAEGIARLMVRVTGADPDQMVVPPRHEFARGWMGEGLVREFDLVPAWRVYFNIANELVGALRVANRAHDARLLTSKPMAAA